MEVTERVEKEEAGGVEGPGQAEPEEIRIAERGGAREVWKDGEVGRLQVRALPEHLRDVLQRGGVRAFQLLIKLDGHRDAPATRYAEGGASTLPLQGGAQGEASTTQRGTPARGAHVERA